MSWKRFFISAGLFSIMVFSGLAFAAQTEIIDTENLSKGIIDITYKKTDSAIYKVLVVKGEEKIVYPFNADGNTETFPLQMGNGTYKIGLLKNAGGNKYAYVTSKTVELNLEDQNVVYLNSIQNISWNSDDEPIEFGRELLKNKLWNSTKIKTLYNYMINNMSYDYDKIPDLKPDYVPDIVITFDEMKGICYDYSALFASIHRSQGIPVKLVKGYSKFVEGYHAWNEIYINESWYIIDSTVDSTLNGSKVTIKMYKQTEDYTKVYEY